MLTVLEQNPQVALFLEHVDKMSELKMIADRENLNQKLHFSAEKEKGVEVRREGPDEEVFRSFLLGLRKFLAPRESTHFFRIYDMCYQAVENPLFRENARLTRAGFASTLKGAPFKYVVDKREVSNEEIIDLFFNGELFHAEPEKAARLKAIGGTFNEPFLKFLLTASTTNLFLYIRNLSILIRRSDDETFLGELLEELTKTDGQAMQSGPYS